MSKSLEKWCKENGRIGILEEYGGVLGEYGQYTEVAQIPCNSSKYIKWNCLKCGSYKALTVKERILLNEIECLKCKKQKALDKRLKILQTETKSMGYLAKTIQSSVPEQYIYYYLKRAFNNIESQKKFEWLDGMSLDMYIPEHKIGIEYDGERYHSKKLNDRLKFELCKKNSVTLLRVVGSSKISRGKKEYFADWHYLYTPNYNHTNIPEAILELLKYIDSSADSVFHENPINLKKDLVNIEKHIKKEFDKRTLFYKWPELGEYWDFEKNGQIMPNHVFKSDNKTYYLKCPKCNTQYGFRPAKRNKSIPPCPCERNQYTKRKHEILYMYESTGQVEFEDTLLDRQIEDEIKNTAQGMYQCFQYFGTIEVYQLGSSEYSKSFLVEYFNKYTRKRMY